MLEDNVSFGILEQMYLFFLQEEQQANNNFFSIFSHLLVTLRGAGKKRRTIESIFPSVRI